MSSKRPVIRVEDNAGEYIAFLTDQGTIDYIVHLRDRSNVGNILKLQELPWSARWQIERELQELP